MVYLNFDTALISVILSRVFIEDKIEGYNIHRYKYFWNIKRTFNLFCWTDLVNPNKTKQSPKSFMKLPLKIRRQNLSAFPLTLLITFNCKSKAISSNFTPTTYFKLFPGNSIKYSTVNCSSRVFFFYFILKKVNIHFPFSLPSLKCGLYKLQT